MVQPAKRRREGSPRLTAPQLALLKVLWERSEATVAEMQRALHAERPLAATTIATYSRGSKSAGSLPTAPRAGSMCTARSSTNATPESTRSSK